MKIEFRVNDLIYTLDSEPTRRLLDVLRDELRLTGTKEGCGEGECGACSVLVDGKLVNSCLIPVAQADGADVVTIEGLSETALGKILAESFAETHAVQCGLCTPGMMVAATALLSELSEPTEDEIRAALSGNLCRCTGYDMIVDGVQLAAQRRRDARSRETPVCAPAATSEDRE